MSRRREPWVLAVLLLAAFACRWPFRNAPLVRDEAEYAHMGWSLLKGDVPYRDVYNQKTPFIFWASAAIQGSAGKDPAALRVVMSLWLAAGAAALWAAARALLGSASALWAVLAFAVMTFDQNGVRHAFSTEAAMLPWLCLGLCLWHRPRKERGRPWTALAAGAAAGLTCLTKQTGAALLAYFLAESVWKAWAGRPRAKPLEALRESAAAAAGFAGVLALTALWFWRHGALGSYLECAWLENLSYVGSRARGPAAFAALLLRTLTEGARWDLGLWLLGTAALGWRGREDRGPASGLWLLLAILAAAALSAGQAYAHYFIPLVVPFSLGMGDAMTRLLRGRRPAFLALAVLPWLAPAFRHAQVLSLSQAERTAFLSLPAPYSFLPELAARLKASTSPQDRLAVIGSEPEFYWRAERAACTRAVLTYPLVGPYPSAPRLREEFLAQLRTCRPPYVVVVQRTGSLTEWPGYLRPFLEPVSAVLRPYYEEEWAVTEAGIVPARGQDLARTGMLVLKRRERGQ